MISAAVARAFNSFIDQPAGLFCSNRLLEWMNTGIMLALAILLALSPQVERSALLTFYEAGFSTGALAGLYMVAGAFRAAALIANGRVPVYGPRLRSAGCIVGTLMWLEMAFALIRAQSEIGFLPLSAVVYFFLALGEFFSCYRAATDVRFDPR